MQRNWTQMRVIASHRSDRTDKELFEQSSPLAMSMARAWTHLWLHFDCTHLQIDSSLSQ